MCICFKLNKLNIYTYDFIMSENTNQNVISELKNINSQFISSKNETNLKNNEIYIKYIYNKYYNEDFSLENEAKRISQEILNIINNIDIIEFKTLINKLTDNSNNIINDSTYNGKIDEGFIEFVIEDECIKYNDYEFTLTTFSLLGKKIYSIHLTNSYKEYIELINIINKILDNKLKIIYNNKCVYESRETSFYTYNQYFTINIYDILKFFDISSEVKPILYTTIYKPFKKEINQHFYGTYGIDYVSDAESDW